MIRLKWLSLGSATIVRLLSNGPLLLASPAVEDFGAILESISVSLLV